jgi:hypothetical protein
VELASSQPTTAHRAAKRTSSHGHGRRTARTCRQQQTAWPRGARPCRHVRAAGTHQRHRAHSTRRDAPAGTSDLARAGHRGSTHRCSSPEPPDAGQPPSPIRSPPTPVLHPKVLVLVAPTPAEDDRRKGDSPSSKPRSPPGRQLRTVTIRLRDLFRLARCRRTVQRRIHSVVGVRGATQQTHAATQQRPDASRSADPGPWRWPGRTGGLFPRLAGRRPPARRWARPQCRSQGRGRPSPPRAQPTHTQPSTSSLRGSNAAGTAPRAVAGVNGAGLVGRVAPCARRKRTGPGWPGSWRGSARRWRWWPQRRLRRRRCLRRHGLPRRGSDG